MGKSRVKSALSSMPDFRFSSVIVWVSLNASHVFMTAYKNKLFCNI